MLLGFFEVFLFDELFHEHERERESKNDIPRTLG